MSSGIVPAAIRTALQAWWGSVVTWLAAISGIVVTEDQSVAVIGLFTAIAIGLVTAGIRWLETREGDGWQRWARAVASVLMLGMSGQQPTYQAPTKP